MSKDINPSELYGWNIYQIARQQDPYVTWADIRSETPVLDAGEGVYLVTSWDLVDRIVRDPQFLAGRGVAESMDTAAGSKIDVASLWLMSMDGPRHVHARGLVRRPFSARKVEELSEFVTDRVRSIIPGFLDDCRARPTDFLEKVAMNVPSEVIRRLLGIDPRVWTEKVHPRFIASVEDSSSSAMEELAAFFEREEASSGLLDALGAPDDDGNQLTREEVIANAVLLAMAAIDTTAGLIANALVCLLQNPHVLPLAQRDPSLISKVVEETLRLEPSALSCSRFAPDAFELGGYSVPAESHLVLSIGAANRDPAKYASPDEFRLDRDYAGLLTFGGGRHFCLGASLARMEARIILTELLPALSYLELAMPISWQTENPNIRLPTEVMLSMTRS